MAQITVREQQPVQHVHALRAQKRFRDELGGVRVAAVNQQIVFSSRRVAIYRMAAAQRQDGQARGGEFALPLQAPEK